jgi:hypothetical protein
MKRLLEVATMKLGEALALWLFLVASMISAAPSVAMDQLEPVERPTENGLPPDDPEACSQSKRDEVLEPALDEQGIIRSNVNAYVDINCNLTLKSSDVVTKILYMAGYGADGVTIDCNGATIRGDHWRDYNQEAIVVSSASFGRHPGRWRGAKNVTVRNCIVHGRVRVAGGGPSIYDSSGRPNHTQEIQRRSPKNIVFDNLDIVAHGADPVYVFPGAMGVTLINSRISGKSNGVAIYLDAESAEHVIKDNEIGVDTDGREQIAIDGSARNLIVGNRFSSGLANGGIFIYRNCGEKGVIRHQYPEDNVILDNVFDYRVLLGYRPVIWIASRQNNRIGWFEDLWRDDLCNDDDGRPRYGSNLDNRDHAQRTVVAQNRFIGHDPAVPMNMLFYRMELIKIEDDPSYVFDNVRDDQAQNGNSSCYVANAYPTPIVAHGKSIAVFDDGSGPRCTGQRLSCNDGKLTAGTAFCASVVSPRLSIVPFECRAEGNNGGCSSRVACPSGMSAVATKAACNLESGSITDNLLSTTPWSFAGVVRRSDSASDGVCVVGGVDVSERGAVLGRPGANQIAFSCREHDRNGGDCHVRGSLACEEGAVFEN